MGRRTAVLGLAIVLVLIGGVAVVYPRLTGSANPLGSNRLLSKGSLTYYAFGSEVSVPVSLSKAYRLTGGFDTNTSVIFYIMTPQEYENQHTEPKSQVSYYYSSGNVKGAMINTTIVSGDYDLVFDFVNSTGRIVTTSNGTGLVSMTALTITQTFTLAPLS